MHADYSKEIERIRKFAITPDKAGEFGTGFNLTKRWHKMHKDEDATHTIWLLHTDKAHPMWKWYLIFVIDLVKPIEGIDEPAHFDYPEATHEFVISVINPENCPEPTPENMNYPVLLPCEVQYQFHGLDDDQIGRTVDGAISTIVSGKISPDSDFRWRWVMDLMDSVAYCWSGEIGYPHLNAVNN